MCLYLNPPGEPSENIDIDTDPRTEYVCDDEVTGFKIPEPPPSVRIFDKGEWVRI